MVKTIAVALALSGVSFSALAEGPTTYTLGREVKVDLGAGWDMTQMSNAAMSLEAMRKMLSEALEIRIRKDRTAILVSTMSYRPVDGKSLDTFDLVQNAQRGAQGYLGQAVETEALVESRTNGSVSTAFVTLHARPDQKFNVRAGYPGGCVSSGNLRKGWTVIVVSIASDSCESDTHRAALQGFLAAHE